MTRMTMTMQAFIPACLFGRHTGWWCLGIALLGTIVISPPQGNAAPPTLTNLVVTPDILRVAEEDGQVTFTVEVSDPDGDLNPRKVKVTKLQDGQPNQTLAIMQETLPVGQTDGAGDTRHFTATVNFGTQELTLLHLKVKAKDLAGEKNSLTFTLPVVEPTDGFSNTKRVIIMGEFPCLNADAVEVECRSLKAIIDPPREPDQPKPINVILTVRRKHGVPLRNRWIVFDVGGRGGGYGQQSGSLGGFTPGRKHGDDLIRWYNDLDYVTLDISWWCNPNEKDCTDEQKDWLKDFGDDRGQGWYRDSNGLGFIVGSHRLTPIHEWVHEQNGRKRVGAHAHSSGSGRLITMLALEGGTRFVHTAVFDGGPVFTYVPWFCEIDEGPLGPQVPDRYVLSDFVPNGGRKRLFDIASDDDNGAGNYHFCVDGVFEEKMVTNSILLVAKTRNLRNTHLAVVLGGRDNSPASSDARLWFQGYDATAHGGPRIPPMAATTLTIIQGYCPPDSTGTYPQQGRFDFPCANWNAELFPTADAVIYDETLADTTHSTSASQEGANAMFKAMLMTMPAADE